MAVSFRGQVIINIQSWIISPRFLGEEHEQGSDSLGINRHILMMKGCSITDIKRIVLRFHYHSEEVIGSLGITPPTKALPVLECYQQKNSCFVHLTKKIHHAMHHLVTFLGWFSLPSCGAASYPPSSALSANLDAGAWKLLIKRPKSIGVGKKTNKNRRPYASCMEY